MWAVITVCGLAIGLGAGPGFLFGFVGPALQAELRVSRAGLGLLIGLFFGFTGLTSLLAARWGARLGARRCLALNMVTVALGGAAAASWGNYPVLAVVAVTAGAAYAFGNVGTNLAVMAVVRPGIGGFALTLKTAGVPAIASVLALGGGWAETAGWRAVAWALAAAGGVVALAVLLTLPRSGGSTVTARAEPPLRRGFWTLPLAAFLFICGTQPLQSWMVTYVHDEAGLPLAQAGQLMAAGTAFGLTGMLGAARWADRLGARRRAVFVALVCVVAAVGIAGLLAGARWWLPLLAAGAVLGVSANLAGAGLTHAVVIDRAPGSVGRASGVTMTGYYAGALVAPWGFGALADATDGYEAPWAVCLVLLLLAAAAYGGAHRVLPVTPGAAAGRRCRTGPA
ncbi:hypothetical protein GCM10012289_65260 [Nonomuraea cavernae]|uniref:Major facilitator superfamily (MFS) profile domain-containing protein n=1 Tax=Nonomuraea cavernae TaxID=2045107 RepID=A0A918DRU3_9ACTN|nr:hypothetical protein GCM10012289_65260 [Nonomuraea cavernae]